MAKLSEEERQNMENRVYRYIQESSQRLEAFTKLDYYLAGTYTIWHKADRMISKMPNYKLIGIYNNIMAEEHGEYFRNYYDVFDYSYLEKQREYTVTQELITEVVVVATSREDAIQKAKHLFKDAEIKVVIKAK